LLPSFFFSSREKSKCGGEVDTKISGVCVKKNCVHESNKMVRRTRFWKGKKWQFAVKQQQQNDDGDDVVVSTDDSHFVFCNRPALNAQFRYVTNMTSTRKYSWWSFLPRSLFEQYRRAAYWYFTAMAALSLAPFSPYNHFSVWLPLAFVLILGILRELWEDLRRYREDNLVNSRPVLVHDGEGHLLEKQWKHLCVGDVVKVMDGDYFPADLLLLSSTGPEGICYVETMNLDGETNLKVKKLTPFFICGLHDCFIVLLIER
jgi:magnesium-transporting ATPase (P-type)